MPIFCISVGFSYTGVLCAGAAAVAVQLMAWISSHPVMLRDTLLLIAALRKHAMHDESVRIRGRRKRNSNPTQLFVCFHLLFPCAAMCWLC